MDESAKLAPGPGRPQLIAVTLKALLREQYNPKMVPWFDKRISEKSGRASGLLAEGAIEPAAGAPAKGKAGKENAPAGERAQTIKRENKILFDAGTAFLLAYSLKSDGFQLSLTREQEDILFTAYLATSAWTEMEALGLGAGRLLPDWYNEWIFDRQMASRSDRLLEYGEGFDWLPESCGATRPRPRFSGRQCSRKSVTFCSKIRSSWTRSASIRRS